MKKVVSIISIYSRMEVVGEAVRGGKRVETKTLFERGGKFRARQDVLPPHLTRGQPLKARGEKSHSHPLVWYHSVITCESEYRK